MSPERLIKYCQEHNIIILINNHEDASLLDRVLKIGYFSSHTPGSSHTYPMGARIYEDQKNNLTHSGPFGFGSPEHYTRVKKNIITLDEFISLSQQRIEILVKIPKKQEK